MLVRFDKTVTVWDYLNPFRPILFRYFIQSGSTSLQWDFVTVRDVLLATGQAAVEATGSGPLGLSGEKVGAGEQEFIDKLSSFLS